MTGRKYFLAMIVFVAAAAVMPRTLCANPNAALSPALNPKNYDTGPAQPGLGAPTTNPNIPRSSGGARGGNDNSVLKGQGELEQAPWVTNQPKPKPRQANEIDEFYVGPVAQGETSGLNAPHRSQNEVADFLVHALTEILSIEYNTVLEKATGKVLSHDEYQKRLDGGASEAKFKEWSYDEHLKALAVGMDPNALNDFQDFMVKSNILQTLETNNLIMRIIVEEQPLLLNKGEVDGRYRWLYEMPVTLSFLVPGAKSYENAPASLNKHVIIRMQVGHVAKKRDGHKEDPGIDEMMIESFQVRDNSDKHL